MARITLEQIRHSYLSAPSGDADWALKQIDLEWADGGAYALLGPSGCGKTTLLNIISGLVRPSRGQVRFDGADVTGLDPVDRHVAQVFQFPVIYDTMTVHGNLAFPLRNRAMPPDAVDARVREVAGMLDLQDKLSRRASRLTADEKQKISLGRGLVRSDVNVIMFDEPLTVIDPHMKWVLRSKLKELHREFGVTMIYVTHDQTEALTFADTVVVMYDGAVVQVGTPVELFERPRHTFVGHFIGSPGMNVLPCTVDGAEAVFDGVPIPIAGDDDSDSDDAGSGPARAARVARPRLSPSGAGGTSGLELGVRPEFVCFSDDGFAVEVTKVDDVGRYRIVDIRRGSHLMKMVVGENDTIPSENPRIRFDPAHTRVYADGWLVAPREAER
ncbi:MAG: ABC transporter ATP-binding protein [Thiotrichales bacterium]|nr:ABC transporter ATP-binding protein [Thiotrichales bacterium]